MCAASSPAGFGKSLSGRGLWRRLAVFPAGHLPALATAVSLYALAAGGVIGWLAVHGADTTQRRIAQSPSITVLIAKPVTPSPGSTVPRSEAEPPADPQNSGDAPLLPMVPQTVAPATLPPAASAVTPAETPVTSPPAAEPAASPPAVETPPPAAMPEPPARTGWQAQARPFNMADKRPRIALIVTDLGFATKTTQAAIKNLPGDVTLALQTTSPYLSDWATQARSGGHEILLAVPMEPAGYPDNDPGPQTLLNSLPPADNLARLRAALAQSDQSIGIMPAQGDAFIANSAALAPVLDELHMRDLVFVDGTGNAASVAAGLATAGGVPFAQSRVILDATAARDALEQGFAQLETQAKTSGAALGIVLPYPAAFERLTDWLKTLPGKGLVLAPASTVLANTETVKPTAPASKNPAVEPVAKTGNSPHKNADDLSHIKRH